MNQPTYEQWVISWMGREPWVPCETGRDAPAHVGSVIYWKGDKYRIFGFTDFHEWRPEYKYHQQPCDDRHNRLFALGRKEND